MIEIKDIQTAIAKLLTENKYTVTASEVKEGFTKPTCFIDVMPVSTTLQNKYTELVNVSVEIAYHPLLETKEEAVNNAEKLKNIFLYTPISVCDRFLSTDEIIFDYDKSVLYANFSIEFLQETKLNTKSIPKMKTILINERTDNSGTSENTD